MRLGDPLDRSVTSPSACFTTVPSCTVIFVAGFWDNSFKCFDTNSGMSSRGNLSCELYIYSCNYILSSFTPPIYPLSFIPSAILFQEPWFRVCLVTAILSAVWTSPLRRVSMGDLGRGLLPVDHMMPRCYYGDGLAGSRGWWALTLKVKVECSCEVMLWYSCLLFAYRWGIGTTSCMHGP